jgi:hypothetical protein
MCLEGHRLSGYLFIDEFGEFFHDITFDFIQQSLEVSFISICEFFSIVGDFLCECFSLFIEVSF